MKPAPFTRHVPKTLDDALKILAQVAPDDGRILAGGQSLVPIMAFRLAKPAHLVDIKDHDFPLLTGIRPAGIPVHDMWVRVTIDRAFNIVDIEAVTDSMPYPGLCDRIGPDYRKLIGANLVQGFRKRLHDAMGHTKGCTHITEMLANVPTAAIQLFAGLRKREDEGAGKPFQLDKCHALETTGDQDIIYG